MYKSGGFLLGICLLVSCKPGVPSGIIQPDDLEELLYDYHLAQAMAEKSYDSVNYKRYSYVKAVFEKHEVSEAEFDSAMVWYSSHATYLKDIYARLHVRYEEHVSALGAVTGESDAFAHLGTQGDTANIWHEYAFRILKPRYTEDRLTFSLTADSTFYRGDALLWRFEPRYISRNRKSQDAYAGLYVRYDNDSIAGVTERVYANNQMRLQLNGDTAYAIREVGGFVYYKASEDEKEPRLMIIQDIMLVRIHREGAKPDAVKPDLVKPAVARDTLPVKDSVVTEVLADSVAGHRLSPTELRDSRPVERSIHVVKEKPYRVVRKSGNTRNYGGPRR